MDLCLASHRAVLKALQAFEDGELALVSSGPLTLSTLEGDLRFYDGVCFAAPRGDLVGAELVGWLEELDDLSGVGAWWRPGLRAVLRTPQGRALASAASNDLSLGGLLAASGFATHTARFLVAHGERPAARGDAPPQAAPTRSAPPQKISSRPVKNTPSLVSLVPSVPVPSAPRETAATIPVADLASGIRPSVVRGNEREAPLRARGEWRATGLFPWTLGEGRPPPRLTQPVIAARQGTPAAPARPADEVFFRRAAS